MLYMIYSASLPKRIKGGQEFMIDDIITKTRINKVTLRILHYRVTPAFRACVNIH